VKLLREAGKSVLAFLFLLLTWAPWLIGAVVVVAALWLAWWVLS
jgi:hypothetical protein